MMEGRHPRRSGNNAEALRLAGADIKVVAHDPNAMAKALEGKAKLARLIRPARR